MAGLFPPPSEMRPTFKDDSDAIPYKAQPLGPKSFTGMSESAVEDRYRYNAISSEGPTNMGGGNLYKDRLAAEIEASRDPNSGYNAWNKKRQEAIDRGEDPNSALLAMIEARQPDSYLERAWRKMTGKKKTRAEEREAKEAKARKKMEVQVEGKKEADVGIAEIHGGAEAYKQDDGVIR